jgi:hypothetical protein
MNKDLVSCDSHASACASLKVYKPGRIFFMALFSMVFSICSYAQPGADDVMEADMLAKTYKDNNIVCTSSYHSFTFDKGKNSFDDKVVAIEENTELEFLSLKKYSSLNYPEYYNKFIELKSFKKAIKYGNKFITSDRSGIDRGVTDENIFFDDSRVRYFPLRFTDKGAVARITVKKEYSDGKYLTRLFFHSPYPVLEQVFEFKVPEWLSIDFKEMNFQGQSVEKKQTSKGGYTTYVFTMRNLPATKSEFQQIGHAYTDPHIVIQLKSFQSKGEMLQGFDNIKDVYKWNNRLYSLAGNKDEPIKAAVSKITAGAQTDLDKIKAIYYYVQDKIRYIAFEDGYSGYIPASAQDVLTNKYSDCKGMANLLTEMLKTAGFDAHFTWIGTRSIPYPQSLPALCVNNHAITTLYYQGKEYFLDGTEKYAPFGENAYRIQGKEAMVANGEKFDIKTVPLTTGNDHKVFTKADFVLNNEVLKGKVQVTLTGNERKDFHQVYHGLPITAREEFFSSFLEFNNKNVEASDIQTSDLNNRDIPVTISGNIDLTNFVQTISGNKYINLDFFPKTLDGYMPDEKRVSGYDLDYVQSFQDEFTLTIPQGNRFADIPEKLELKSDAYEFSGEYILQGNKITLKKNLVLKKSVINQKDLQDWKKFLTSIKEFSGYFFSVSTK